MRALISATSTLLGYHVGLIRNGGGITVQLNHTQVIICHGYTAECAV